MFLLALSPVGDLPFQPLLLSPEPGEDLLCGRPWSAPAEEAVKMAAVQAEPIFVEWRERGKI
jgi:hypothetical protein